MFSSFGGSGPPPAPALTTPSGTTANTVLVIPNLDGIFPYLRLAEEIENSSVSAGPSPPSLQLHDQICSALVDLPAIATGPDESLRNRLCHDSNLLLQINHSTVAAADATTSTTTASTTARLPPAILPEIIDLANALQIPETTAIGLYHHAATTTTTVGTNNNYVVASSASSSNATTATGWSVKEAAIALYWECRLRQIQLAKHALVQNLSRTDPNDDNNGIVATSNTNTANHNDEMALFWWNLLQHAARGLDQRKVKKHYHHHHPQQLQPPQPYPFSAQLHTERTALAEVIYFVVYLMAGQDHHSSSSSSTPPPDQWSALIAGLAAQEKVDVLDPFHQVPAPNADIVTTHITTTQTTTTLQGHWERALVAGAYSLGLPQSLSTYAILMTAVAVVTTVCGGGHPQSQSSHSQQPPPPFALIDLAELRYTIIPVLSTLPTVVDGLVVTRDFCLTSIGQYLATTTARYQHHHQQQHFQYSNTDWYASANLLCGLGFAWVFVQQPRPYPPVLETTDDPHALVFAYYTNQQHDLLLSDKSNEELRQYKSHLDGTLSSSARSASTALSHGKNAYYGNDDDDDDYNQTAAAVVVQRTLNDADRASVMAYALHATDLALVLEFALGTPIDRHVRGILFEAAGRIIRTGSSSSSQDDDNADVATATAVASLRADHALRLLAEFHAVPPQRTAYQLQHQQQPPPSALPPHSNFMFFMPSDVTKASNQQHHYPTTPLFGSSGRFDATYGMLFSVIIAEQDTGYEATVGFLRLLTSIAHYTMLPARYAEYAVFVLDHVTAAPTDRDHDRVTAAALELLQVVLVRYHNNAVSSSTSSSSSTKIMFGYDELNRHLVVTPPPHNNGTTEQPVSSSSAYASAETLTAHQQQDSSSAGFFVLVSMLCRNRCSLLQRIIDVLKRQRRRRRQWSTHTTTNNVAVDNAAVLSHDQLTLTRALYRETPPSLSKARIGASRPVTADDRKSAAERERQNLVFFTSDDYAVKALQSALTILCGTLIRETDLPIHHYRLKYFPTMNSGRPINDVTLHWSAHLVHLFAEAGSSAWEALIEAIGMENGDPVVEAMVPSLATAALWGLLDKLTLVQTAQVLNTQCDNRCGGTSLAKAVTRRLESYSSRPLQSEDISYLRFLLKSVLADLNGAHKLISSSLFGSSSQVMEALLELLESDEFLFGDESADVAVHCYEAVYLLTKVGGSIGDVLIAAKRASRLREKDFWNVSLKRLFHSGRPTTVHHLLAVSWLLQGFANELYLVGGAGSAVAVIVPPADQQLLAPQPYLLGRYVSDLMLEEDGFVRESLKMLPLEAAKPITPPSCLSSEVAQAALESAKVEYPGPVGMIAYVVNTTLLAEKLSRNVEDWDQVELWVESYNTTVFVECTAAHLSDALSLVVGVASANHFSSTGNDRTVAGSKRVFLEVLELLSRRGNLRPATARSLAKMVFVTTGTLSNATLDDEFVSSALRQVLRAISNITSQASSFNDDDQLYGNGTVAILASVFSLLFRSSTGPDYRLDDGDLRDFCAVIRYLMSTSLTGSEASSTIRRLLCACIDISRNTTTDVDNYLGQFFRSVLSDRSGVPGIGFVSNAAALARLVPEEDALLIIGELVTIPGIASFMIDQGVVTALLIAAQNYQTEEERRLREQQQSLTRSVPSDHFPPNLLTILKCLSSFMTVTDLDTGRRTELFVNALGTMKCFEEFFYHAANNFPKFGSTTLLLEFTRYLFQVQIFKRSLSSTTHPVLIDARSKDDDIPSYAKSVARLSLHIAGCMLPGTQNHTNGLRVWWEEIDTGVSGSFFKQNCQIAKEAADLSCLGLSLLLDLAKEGRIEIEKLDEAEMCQTIRGCFETLMTVKRQMGSFVGVPRSDPLLTDLQDVEGLFHKGHALLSVLLLLALARTESFKMSIHGPRSNSAFIETSRTMEQLRHVDVLDGVVHQDENQKGTLSQLVDAVKKECGSVANSAFLAL